MALFRLNSLYDTEILELLDIIVHEERTAKCLQELSEYDQYTYWHSVRVAILSMRFGFIRKLDKGTLLRLGAAAVLHDYGKRHIPVEILNKPSKLTEEEYECMKLHVLYGVLDLQKLQYPADILRAVSEHHEGFQKGYPFKLNKEEVSLMGRILRLADFYDALFTERVYKEGLTHDQAIEIIAKEEDIDANLLRLLKAMDA